MPNLVVRVGADRFHMEPCRINDSFRPHEIRTEHFIGRVLVRILDAPGARILPSSPSGEGTMEEPGREYFHDRSRKFCIQIEGKFTKPWRGDEVLFGTDFDRWIDFPRAPFAAGMRVAKMIDPCTFFDEHPPSGRPYIMSPYVACMNTLCAWPAPARAHDAVVVLRHNTPASGVTSGAASGSGSGLGAAGGGGGGGAAAAQQHKSSTASPSSSSSSPAPLVDGSGSSGAAELSTTKAAGSGRLEGAERGGLHEEGTAAEGENEDEEEEAEEEEDEGDIVPVEALARTGTGTASPLPLTGPSHSHSHASSATPPAPAPASSSTPTPTAKRTGWFGAWGGNSAAQQQKEKEKEERIVKSYWRFVGFKQDPRVRAFLEAHHASLEKMARQPSRNRSRSRPNTPRTAAAGSSGAHANAGSGSGSANASATRTNSANSSPTLLERALSPSASPAIGGNLPLSASPAPIHASPDSNAHADSNAAAGAAGTAGTVATGAAIQMPLLHRLGTGLREQGQGGKTPEPFGDDALSPTLLADAQLAVDGEGNGNANIGADGKSSEAPNPTAVPQMEAKSKENGASSAEAHGHAAHSHKGGEHKKDKKEKRTSMLTNPLKVFKPKAALHALNLGGKDEESNEDLARTASPTSTPAAAAGVSANANASAATPAQNEPAHSGRLGHGFGLGFGLKKNKSVSSGHSQSTTTASSQPHAPASPKKEPELLPSPVTQPQPKQQPATPVPQAVVESPAPTPAPAPTSPPAQPEPQPQLAPAAQPTPEQPPQPAQQSQQAPAQQDDPPVMPELARITTSVRKEMEKSAQGDGLTEEDFKLADRLHHTHVASPPPPPAAHLPAVAGSGNGNGTASTGQDAAQADAGEWHSTLDDELGPWRFSDPGTDMIEDNAFIFTHESVSVPKRRKYFADAKHRSDFVYDPDVVYGASFFTDMASLTTMDLHLGPVKLNIARFFKDMPIRYTLRAADENITFCTISFQLE